jgi:glycosyltransferase involved in cell wall biosynthesis
LALVSNGPRVCIVGPGTRFLSGITYYTFGLAGALAADVRVSAVLMRRLLPRFLYPGRGRVGADLSTIAMPDGVRSYDGVDWFWLPSLFGALRFLRREKPDVLVLQWWTGTVLHTFLALAVAARRRGARVVIEFHESLDTGEDRVQLFSRYVNLLAPRLFRMADQFVVHSEFDRDLIAGRFGLPADAFHVVPHASYDNYSDSADEVQREAPEGVLALLYFGIIRPFKGVEDLVRAFEAIPEGQADRFWLTVVGETWEGHTLPTELIAASPRKDRITFVNRYVQDQEVDAFFRGADIVVLPYHRSSMSGPLQVAMNYGVPVVVTSVGGLVEAASGYGGAVLVEPRNPESLRDGILRAADLVGREFPSPHDWNATRELYGEVISAALTARR